MSDRLTFPIGRCDRDDKVNPAVEHLANKQGCFVRNIFCSEFSSQLKVDLVCPSKVRLKKVERAMKREMVLFKHHHLAGRKRRRS